LNKLLKINKKILIAILLLVSSILILFIFQNNISNNNIDMISSKSVPMFDIINPSFTIKNEKEKISVKAKGGNFLTNNKILLEKNVMIVSPNFKLYTEKVIYNQENQSAESKEKSKFESKTATIISEGFNINDNGSVIFFNGNTKLIMNK
tara:strand:- start:4083 stop:4532 length:450 start_codon:yes stop_codon:yes gene_type:complete